MSVQRLTVFTPPSPEAVTAVTRCLGDAGVNGVTMLINRMQEGDALRLIVDKPAIAKQALEKAGFMVAAATVVAIEIPDEPGAIAKLLDLLSLGKIEYDFMNVFPSGKNLGKAVVVLIPKKPKALETVLEKSNYRTLDGVDLT